MTYSLNIPLEVLRGLFIIPGWYVLFYLRHRPASKIRRVVLLASFPVCYIAWRVYFITGITVIRSNGSVELIWVASLFLFALLCGDLRESLFTAIYYIGMEACMDTLRNFIARYTLGRGLLLFSPGYYAAFYLLYLAILGWALFYYWVLKDRRGKLPLNFWIMTVIPPLGSAVLITRFASAARPLLEIGINIYLEGILFGFFMLALNLFTFYMYVRLLAYYESHLQAQVLQGQLDAQSRRITGIEVFQRQTGEMRHELKNLLFSLKVDMEQQNYDGVNNRIWAMLGDLKQVEPEYYTGVSLIDAMISFKAVQIKELGAAISVQADVLDIETTLAYDIASIMGIALDNVVDAVTSMKAQEGAPSPAVHCKIQSQKNILLIQVTNPLSGPLHYKNGEIQTTKTEGGHGLGLPALRRVAQKYAGEVTISDSGNVFCLSVMLFV
ncbi:hypothetical protein AGMMS49942_24100 [Spirochaetia bacterium]|nr:hypothetical protein AGMMS49942_24100 [Spirochaetia bacterium]